jgi:hypothetical protein
MRFKGRDGAPRIYAELAKDGVNISRKRIARLVRELRQKDSDMQGYDRLEACPADCTNCSITTSR